MLKAKKTLRGPGGIKLVLDPAEVFPDDPGQGTPALVEYKGGTATFWCAQGEGYVDSRNGDIPLTEAQSQWLHSDEIEAAVAELYS